MHPQYIDPESFYLLFEFKVMRIGLAAQEFHILWNSQSNDVTQRLIGKPTLGGLPDVVFFLQYARVISFFFHIFPAIDFLFMGK